MTMAERLYKVGSKLPPSVLAELLDFAEFLEQRNSPLKDAQRMSLAVLGGGLEDSVTFSGSPLAIQEHMRREWD